MLEGDQAGVSKSDPRWYQQMWACQQLHDTGHGACWFMVSDDQADVYARYRFMHAKYVLIDRQRVLITSQNLTDRGLPDDDRSNGTSGSRGVLLVTDATHMRRSEACFRAEGIEVVPAACRHLATEFRCSPRKSLPSTSALKDLETAAHEWIGLAWYWLHGRV